MEKIEPQSIPTLHHSITQKFCTTMKKLLFLLTIFSWQHFLFCQIKPTFILPIMKNSNEYLDNFYSPDKNYSCEMWLYQYTQLYQSNRSREIALLKPSEKYASIKHKAQKDNAAKFIFELYNTYLFKAHTSSTTVEQLLDDNQPISHFEPFIEEDQLLLTGILLPHTMTSGDYVEISPENSELLFSYVDEITFYASRTSSNNGPSDGVKLGYLNGTSYRTSIPRSALNFIKVNVLLKNGKTFTYTYSHEKCLMDPDGIALEPDPTPPPSDPVPRIPTLDVDCNIKPSYFNHPASGLPYDAKLPYVDNNTGFTIQAYEIVGYITDPDHTYSTPIYELKSTFIPSPYSSTVNPAVHGAYGQVKTTVFLNPYHTKLKKPFIVTDGIDFLSNRTWKEILENLGGNDMISLLWDGDYDLVIADFAGGADYIQRNSYALIELIRSLRHDEHVKEIAGIVGPSMGGQIVRHALLYWEKYLTSDPAYGNHNVALFVSADSPWNGANASPAVQAFARHYKENSPAMMQVDMSANSPAARQLLLNQIDGTGNQTPNIYMPAEHALKTQFDQELDFLGSVPRQVGKIIAIADGAGNGTTSNVAPGGLILGIDYETCNAWYLSECEFTTEMRGVNSLSNLIFKECTTLSGLGFSCNSACENFPLSQINMNTSRLYDSCPASPFRLSQYFSGFKKGMEIYNLSGFKLKVKDIRFVKNFAFIPTFSALKMPVSSINTDFTQTATLTPYGYNLPGCPFDYVYFDNADSGHNSFSATDQVGSLPFLLTNLDYQTHYATKCLINQTIANPTQIFYVEQGGYGSQESFCLPFKYEDYHINGENPCALSLLTNEGSNAIFIQSGLVDKACETDAEICFDTDCGEKCLSIHVVTYPGGTNLVSTTTESNETDVMFYPNPSSSHINTNTDLNKYYINVYDALGQKINYTINDNTLMMKTTSSGIHFIELKSKDTGAIVIRKKIIIH